MRTRGGTGLESDPIDVKAFVRPYAYGPSGHPERSWDGFWPNPTYVIQNAAQLRTAWFGREYRGIPFGEPPSLDFTKQMLISVSMGGGSACSELRVTRIFEAGGELTVESQWCSKLSPRNACIFSVKPVFDFVCVPQSSLPVRFLPIVISTK